MATNGTSIAKFQVLTAVFPKTLFFCDLTLCRWASFKRKFLHLLTLENKGTMFLRNVENHHPITPRHIPKYLNPLIQFYVCDSAECFVFQDQTINSVTFNSTYRDTQYKYSQCWEVQTDRPINCGPQNRRGPRGLTTGSVRLFFDFP
jgi:hypothetical protein